MSKYYANHSKCRSYKGLPNEDGIVPEQWFSWRAYIINVKITVMIKDITVIKHCFNDVTQVAL